MLIIGNHKISATLLQSTIAMLKVGSGPDRFTRLLFIILASLALVAPKQPTPFEADSKSVSRPISHTSAFTTGKVRTAYSAPLQGALSPEHEE